MKPILLAAALLTAAPLAAKAPVAGGPVPAGLKLDRVVLMMRHGVRPPTKAPPMPAGTASAPWPTWPVKPGYLTPHGRAAVATLARNDRSAWIAAGLLRPTGCMRLRVVADSDERTIETARAYAGSLASGCAQVIEHKPQDVPDPLFAPLDQPGVAFDPAQARAAVLADAGGEAGLAAEEARLRPLLARLDAVLCAPVSAACGVSRAPSGLAAVEPGKRPKLTGALDRASTAAQILLLEYADGKPMAEVGWGRVSAADIGRFAEFHAAEFRLLARPRYVARANLALLAPLIVEALTAADGPAVTMISGHDTNVASLGGLLGLHWQVPGVAADDPLPGGAIVLERLVDRAGRHYVRARYRAQTLAQIRDLAPATGYDAILPIAGCNAIGVTGLCTEAEFVRALTR
ncbi:phosphoanhydride phosphohydrolase [Sphingomonas metalli]|uniref:Phosphoanhydride phosphohydrolase n=1 Tax=Sphingomonas metalli TaxID=1779358 RepID=A0A916TE22_9SPHN|nr:histidine-type phosphatase [Sphingomonas metalli]GGB41828.1 phosphoanhydride phosphohydrolase [Sphingomonas metalli]